MNNDVLNDSDQSLYIFVMFMVRFLFEMIKVLQWVSPWDVFVSIGNNAIDLHVQIIV